MDTPQTLEISEYGRYVVWLAEWSWYDHQSHGSCAFSNKAEAIAYATFQAKGFMDWTNFPDPAKQYPYDDRDGTNNPPLSPTFVARWANGYVRVIRTEIADKFDWGAGINGT